MVRSYLLLEHKIIISRKDKPKHFPKAEFHSKHWVNLYKVKMGKTIHEIILIIGRVYYIPL